MIITRTPYRVSLLGGGTDYPEFYEAEPEGGAVLGFALDRYAWLTVRYLPPYFEHRHRIVYSRVEQVSAVIEIEHPIVRETLRTMEFDRGAAATERGLEIHHDGDAPAMAGLGSSSSFAVGLINALTALRDQRASAANLARAATHVERVRVGDAVGCQDQVFAAYGGLNRIGFHRGSPPVVEPLILPPHRRAALLSHLVLVFTGRQRRASVVAAAQLASLEARRHELRYLRSLVADAEDLLTSERPIAALGELLDRAWTAKRALSGAVSNPEIDALYNYGRRQGATGGKLLGAGGGGFFLFVVPPENRDRFRCALASYILLDPGIDTSGSRVVVYQPC